MAGSARPETTIAGVTNAGAVEPREVRSLRETWRFAIAERCRGPLRRLRQANPEVTDPRMRLSPLTVVLGLALGGTGAQAHEVKHGSIAIVHPWVLATVVPSANAVVSFKIKNGGKHADQLVSVSSPRAPQAELVDAQNSHLDRVGVQAHTR